MDTITYRVGTEGDIPAFLAYFRQSIPALFSHYSPNMQGFLVEADYSPEWITESLSTKKKKVFLALHNSSIAGYILASHLIAGVAFADWLAVGREYQNKGIASKLLSMWEEDVLAQGGHNIYLWTYDFNVAFYNKRGFVTGGEFKKAWAGENVFLMYKVLQEPKEENFLRTYLEKKRKAQTP